MLRNLLSVVILSIFLNTSAQAISPRAVKKFYQSLHKILKSKQVQNKAGYTDLTPLHEFLQGKPLDKDMRDELAMFSDEYGDILKTKSKAEEIAVSIEDLLKYSKLQETRAYDELFDTALKSLPAENKLYLFSIKLTLADDTVVTLIKPGMSNANNARKRVKEQIRLLEGIADNLDEVTFTLPQKGTLKVKAMHIEQESLAGRKKYLDLNFGVTDDDVHRHLHDIDYQMVRGIPNSAGGEKKEVFIKIVNGKYEDSNQIQDVADMLEYADISTYRERRSVDAINTKTGISLDLGEYRTKYIFAQMQDRASEFKDKKSELASILADIKWYKHEKGKTDEGEEIRRLVALYDEFASEFTKDDQKLVEKVESLSEEVFLMRRIIADVRKEGEHVQDVARRLGVDSEYSLKKLLKDGLDSRGLVLMDLTLANDYAKNTKLRKLFADLMNLRKDKEQITKAKDLLQKSIDKAGGWDELQKAFETSKKKLGNKQGAGQFRINLADAALAGKDEKQIAETIILYRIIAVVGRGKEAPSKVAVRFGFGNSYSYRKHLKDGLSSKRLLSLDMTLANDYAKNTKLRKLFADLMNLRKDKEQITKAKDLLQKSIDKAGGWDELQKAFETSKKKLGNKQGAGQFRINLADAALAGKDEKQIAETIILYRIIAAVRMDGEELRDVVKRLDFGMGSKPYTIKKHLNDGFDNRVLVSMDLKLANDYAERDDLRNLFTESINLRDDAEQITKASNLLQQSIDKAGGWQALEKAMQATRRNSDNESSVGQFRNNLADAALAGKDENQIAEAITLYRIISVVRRDGEQVPDVARRLDLDWGYSHETHLKKEWSFVLKDMQVKIDGLKGELDEDDIKTIDDCMDILRELDKPKDINLPKLFEDLISKKAKGDAEQITEAKELLQKSVDKAGGWDELQKAFETSKEKLSTDLSASKFRYNLADAALAGRDENQIAEAIAFYRIIAVVRRDGEEARHVVYRLGLDSNYSSKKHLEDGLDSKALVRMNIALANDYADNTKLHDLFAKIIELRGDKKQITEANDSLRESIEIAGGWQALQKALKTSGEKSAREISAGHFRSNLADAVFNGKDEEQITEAITFYRIIAAVRRGKKEEAREVVKSLDLGSSYSSEKHLNGKWQLDLKKLQKKINAMRDEPGNKYDFDTLDNCMKILRDLRGPEQLNLPFAA